MESMPTYTFVVTEHLEGEYYKCELIGNVSGPHYNKGDLVCQVEPATCRLIAPSDMFGFKFRLTSTYYDFNMKTTNKYLLRIYCRADVKEEERQRPKKPQNPQYAMVSESFDCTWATWFKTNVTTTADNNRVVREAAILIRELITAVDDLFENFKAIHDMDANHIYIIGGNRVKFAQVDIQQPRKGNRKDCQKGVFDLLKNSLPKNLQGELRHFIFLTSVCTREKFLFYRNHPAISVAEERCSLLRYAFDTSKINQFDTGLEIDLLIKNNNRYARIMTTSHQDWRPKIKSTRLMALKNYKAGSKYQFSPVSQFVAFSRAAVEHANDEDVIALDSNPIPHTRGNKWMTYEEVDAELSKGWEYFMTLWFDYCLHKKYFNMFHFSAL